MVIALAVVLAALVVVSAVVVPRLLGDEDGSGGADEGRGSSGDEGSPGVADLDDVRTSDPEPSHIDGDLDYPDYPDSPPAGGAHNDAWLACGVYDEPVPEENAVHDLEHGTVWITYRPGLDDEEVDALAGALPDNGILSPYDDLRAPVVVTVWGRQLDLAGADDPRLELFIEEFAEGVTAPEPFASCSGGVTLEQLEDLGLDA